MRIKIFAAFLLLLISAGTLQFYYDSQTDYFAQRKAFVNLPSGKTLKILSFGYDNVVADMLFVWSIQFYSSTHLANRYEYIEHVYNVITDLNPSYKAPYLVGSWIMGLEAKKYRMAVRLLEKGSRNNPKEWIFDYEAGFYAYKDLKDFALAEKLFKRAAGRPGAPRQIRRNWAHFVYMIDNLDYALTLWQEIAAQAETQLEKDSAFNHLYQISFERDRQAFGRIAGDFKKKYGRFPRGFEELLKRGYIRAVPLDYQRRPYIYDAQNGTIKARRSYKWKG